MWNAIGLLALLVMVAGCQKSPTVETAQKSAVKITVAYTTQPQSTLIDIAVAKGYFADEGLEVTPLVFTFGKASLQSLLEHKSDFATVAETPFMFNVLKGEKLFAIANIEASTQNNAIVARKDAAVAVAADLKGKRIGFTPGTTSDFFLDSMLAALGLGRQDIVPVALKPEEMQAAIMARKVDAVCTWNYPLTLIKHQLGANGILFYDQQIYTETYNVAARQDFVNQNPQTVKSYLRALVKAEAFVAAHPDEAQNIVSAFSKVDKDIVREVWDAFHYRLTLDQTLLITLQDETRWAMKNGLAKPAEMPAYENFIHTDSLRAVKPDAVHLRH